MVKNAFVRLQLARKLCPLLSDVYLAILIHTFDTTRLAAMQRLQLMNNLAGHLLSGMGCHEHVIP